ncbi:MAG: hypothetical protein ACTSRG_12855 [Candidatus Helarchaeota archaeon]
MKILQDFKLFLTLLILIFPVVLIVSLFTIKSFSIMIPIPLILLDPNAEIGLIPLTKELTIWETSLNWLFLLGIIIWLAAVGLFLFKNIFTARLKKIPYISLIIGILVTNIALIGSIFIYNMVVYTLITFSLIVSFSFISLILGIFIEISE